MSAWLEPAELRVALGCMRAFFGAGDPAEGARAIEAALDAGVTVLDTARTYGESERIVGEIVRARGKGIRVVTKGGMTREGNAWTPDGRARSIRADCEASLSALGVPIDAYLLHAPDPKVALAVSMRALGKLVEEKLVRRIGVCNVSLRQLDEALELAPIEIVQLALGAADDHALRSGVVGRCVARGITVMAHSPFGGPLRAGKSARNRALAAIAKKHGASPYEIVVAALVDLDPHIVPVVGAARRSSAEPIGRAARVALDDEDREALDARFTWRDALHPRRTAARTDAEIVLLMGLQGSGKSTLAESYVARSYERLNRDALGGTLKKLHAQLDARLAAGAKRIVLDNTYTTRASRWEAIACARRRGATVHGIWVDVSIDDARTNVIQRMLDAHGRLLEPHEMERGSDPTSLPPRALDRTLLALDRPEDDEGFDVLDVRAFARVPAPHARRARFVALESDDLGALDESRGDVVAFAWRPNATSAWVTMMRENLEKRGVIFVHCTHEGGPPRCWCRPPLPGMLLAIAREHGIDLASSVVVGTSVAHSKMASAVGARFEAR